MFGHEMKRTLLVPQHHSIFYSTTRGDEESQNSYTSQVHREHLLSYPNTSTEIP
jgi:hypothetical protein